MNRAQRRKNNASQLFPDDQGALNITIATKGNQVVIEFEKSVRWFAMGKAEITEFTKKLQQHVDLIKE